MIFLFSGSRTLGGVQERACVHVVESILKVSRNVQNPFRLPFHQAMLMWMLQLITDRLMDSTADGGTPPLRAQ
jgi:hypothetical protein